MNKPEESTSVSNPVEPLVSRTLKIKGTHSYSYRTGEWAEVIATEMVKPENLDERPVFVCKFDDGFIDRIVISDNENYELG